METASPRRSYIHTFDAVRAIAVLMVIVSHSGIIWLLPLPIELRKALSRVGWGNFGVVLFFVLSGFLITRILIANKGKENAYKNFLIRRSLRIFPIYYTLIILLLILDPGWYLLDCAAYISNYGFAFHPSANPMGHTWSLSVEEHFYLFWPPMVLFLSARICRLCVFVLFPVASIVGAVLTFMLIPDATDLFYRGTNYQIFALSLGAAMAFEEGWLRRDWRNSRRTGLALLLVSAVTFFLLASVFHAAPVVQKFYSYSLLSAGVVCLFLAINDAKKSFYRLATHPIPSYIGRISYGLYLYHYPIYYSLGTLHAKHLTFGLIAVSTTATFVAAIVSFHFFERPILSLKSRYT